MDFNAAYEDYQQAYIMDSTPLALMGLAELYSEFGLYDEALSHIMEVLKHEDSSWMYYFGVDPERHMMEIDRILKEIYAGMSNRARFSDPSPAGRIKGLVNRLRYAALGWYHDRRYRRASYAVGLLNRGNGNSLDAAWSFYNANEKYRKPGLKYLLEAEKIETGITMLSEGFYLLQRGKLLEDPELLLQSLKKLDPVWERRETAEAIEKLAGIYLSGRDRKRAAILCAELYDINPGAFIGNGLKFPLYLDFKPGLPLRAALGFSGFDIFTKNEDNFCSYKLSPADNLDRGSVYSIQNIESGRTLFTVSVPGPVNTPQKASAFAAELRLRLFNTTDGESGPL